ncbi:MAG: regulatory protein RecX [Lachnospiraceae bacterium]|nr:regulatory protein RecX [Lachnospiraceae bacterium]
MERKITGLETVGKGRKRVYINDEPSFLLYDSELRNLGLKEDSEMTPQREVDIKVVLVKRARLRCMNILTKMDKTTWQLRRKLEEGEYPEDVIEDAIEYVRSFHYIDDLRYAQNYIESRSGSKSRRMIERELAAKGVDSEVIRQAFEEAQPVDATAQILRWMEKKHVDPQQADRRDWDKFFRFLLNKGYSWNDIRSAIPTNFD